MKSIDIVVISVSNYIKISTVVDQWLAVSSLDVSNYIKISTVVDMASQALVIEVETAFFVILMPTAE